MKTVCEYLTCVDIDEELAQWENDNEQSSYPKNRDIEQGQLRYVLRRNLNKTVGS